MIISGEIKRLAQGIKEAGGNLFIVGGAVRDTCMAIQPVDFDLLIVGVDVEDGLTVLGNPQQVVGNAPVFMWGGTEVAFARRETSESSGKHGFSFVADRSVSLFDDLKRRDFTINAMAYNVVSGEFVDQWYGKHDIDCQVLRPIGAEFIESPERVLRGASFSARLDFGVSDDFVEMAQQMSGDFYTIPKEQIWRHWEKMCKLAKRPSNWLVVMQETGWLAHFPALSGMRGIKQSSKYHPEGELLNHVGQVMDMAAEAADSKNVDRVFAITTALLHDVGKTDTTVIDGEKITSIGHEESGVGIARGFLEQICAPIRLSEKVLEGVRLHMRPNGINSKRAVRRLLASMEYITLDELMVIVMADKSGRDKDQRPSLIVPNEVKYIEETAVSLDMSDGFQPVIMGRHLIEMGMKGGKAFGPILDAAKEAQISGEFDSVSDGIKWVKEFMNDQHCCETG